MCAADFSNWMSNLPPHITCQPLNHLAIPGTHDSFSYSITKHSPASPDAPVYKVVSKLPNVVGGSMMQNWTVTQKLTIREQLEAGIRYLDFRVGVKNFSQDPNFYEFYLVHGQYAKTLAEELQDVAEFLVEHPREVVLIDCNHCYEFKTAEQTLEFERVVLKMLGSFMMPPQNSVPSLDEMWAANCQVLFFINLRRTEPIEPNKIWSTARVKSLWPEKTKTRELIEYLNNHYGSGFPRIPSSFYVLQGILTPDKDYMLRHISGSLRHLSKKAGKAYIDWLREPKREAGPCGVNITLLDFAVCDFPDYVSEVIQLNHKTAWPSKD